MAVSVWLGRQVWRAGQALKLLLARLVAATPSYHLISACVAAAPNPTDVSLLKGICGQLTRNQAVHYFPAQWGESTKVAIRATRQCMQTRIFSLGMSAICIGWVEEQSPCVLPRYGKRSLL